MSDSHLSDTAFSALEMHATIQQGLDDAGFSHCTPIQSLALPVALQGKDVAGQAQTGTGKTAAFLLASFQRLLLQDEAAKDAAGHHPRALMLAPTRELAIQIHKDAELLGKHTGLKLALAYGGTGYDQQRDTIAAGCDILIGTPGRVIDYFKQNVFGLDHMAVVVLDEADRMFDLGFIKDMRYLLRRMPEPKARLNMLFSATLSHRVMELAYEHMNDPETLTVETDSTIADGITESVYYPSNDEKIPLMLGLLKGKEAGRSLIFTNTRHAADKVGRWLKSNGFKAAVLTGDVPQRKREALLKAFSNGGRNVLVATDVAARGLHIPDVSHVFNFDLPQDPEDYVHRIGRTARAGAQGEAVSLACEDHAYNLMDIEQYIGHSLPRIDIDPNMIAELQRPEPVHKSRDRKERSDRDRGKPRRTQRKEAKVETNAPESGTTAENQAPITATESPVTETDVAAATATVEPETESSSQQPKPEQPSEDSVVNSPGLPGRPSRWQTMKVEIPAIG